VKIALIGGGGYIGRHLSHQLTSIGAEVFNLSSSNGSGINPDSGLFASSPMIPAGVHAVVYLAQSPLYRDVPKNSAHVLSVNALSAVRVAEVARERGVEKFIYLSTGTVYAPSFDLLSEESPVRRDDWYALSKLHAEECLSLFRKYMDVTIVRPFGVYGPSQAGRLVPNLIESVLLGRPIVLQSRIGFGVDDRGLRISLCFIRDAIDILVKLIFHKSVPCLNLAGPESLSIFEIAEAIGGQIGVPPKFIISETNRDSDLVANISKLKKLHTEFTSFNKGLSSIFAEHKTI
jgi:UDP-glucose 4-epimerase